MIAGNMTADAQPGFSIEVSQNQYLSAGDSEMHAILTINARGLGTGLGGSAPEAAEVILIDCSGSMDWPATKIAAARRATRAAINTLRDGVHFAVVEGTHRPRMVYPPGPFLTAATPESRSAAKQAVSRLTAGGGTAMGSWLTRARELLDAHPGAVRHALLLTDGRNDGETPAELDAVLAACQGHFVCDARGIGDAWEPTELLRIVSVLRGTADSAQEASLPEDFRQMMAGAMRKVVPDLRMRIRTLPGTKLLFAKQDYPTQLDLTEHASTIDSRTVEYSTGAWGDETREYHVCLVAADNHPMDEEVALGHVELVGGPDGVTRPAPAVILAQWIDDPVLPTRLDPKVSRVLGQQDLTQAVVDGCDAYDACDYPKALAEWGRAVKLASAQGNDKILDRLRHVVEIIDAATGVVRLRGVDDVQRFDLISLYVSSVFTTADPHLSAPGPVPTTNRSGPDRTCQSCGRVSPPDAIRCEQCGRSIGVEGSHRS